MVRLTLGGVALVVLAEIVVLATGLRDIVPLVGGAAVAVVLWAFATRLIGSVSPAPAAPWELSPDEALARWRSRTDVMVGRADGTRGDWDRHLRPLLAREFQMTTGHRLNKDPKAMEATGLMVFGDRLWPWVSPTAASFDDREQPGPGTAALDEILTKLERL
ncbi:hypothetical protein [Antrihabitans cavernicola]|uniref:Uncharacterized protein n=1 Tax=Antrihabitans cavernicola TaxID=2495913 RepID=A0A5A7SBY2_9NOCA|nr:hypothetical protein [Spelaeibacter cavernicola]KAA0021995.1 hypothetical protein FOY51_16570 [Spelaeibacter cavernicola]